MIDDFRVHGMASVLDACEKRDVGGARFAATGVVDGDSVRVVAHGIYGDVVRVRTC
ncbi:hypothetical protein D3C84_1161550 [compost metagenome]